MANVKFIAVSRGLRGIVDYVTNREKTIEQLISGVNCVARTAVPKFEAVKKQFRKTEGRGYYHIVQAFAPDDPLDFTTAHELGVKLAEHFEGYRPNYSGDTGYTGDYEHGGSYGDTIDTSGFVSPSTKNNVDLAAYAMQAWENNWGYCWGTYGNILTDALFNYKLQQYPEGVGKYEDFIRANWLGRRTADCIGLIKGYGWLDAASGSINYGTNGMPDVGADQMYANAQKAGMAGTMDTMPELVGIALWKQGHIGVYVGNGYAVEAMGTKYGVVRTEVAGRGWQGWCRIPYIEYREAG